MGTYKIYAGLGGGFGGAVYVETVRNIDEESAITIAYEAACEEYDSMMGMHGLPDHEEFRTMAEEEVYEEDFDSIEEFNAAIDDYADQAYMDDRESWVDYHVEEVTDEDEDDYDETYDSEE